MSAGDARFVRTTTPLPVVAVPHDVRGLAPAVPGVDGQATHEVRG